MNPTDLLIDLSIVVLFLAGVAQFRKVRAARSGNLTAAIAFLCSVLLVLYRYRIVDPAFAGAALFAGCALGWWVAAQVNMVRIPAMVAFQHGAGGVAAFLVAFRELTRADGSATVLSTSSGYLGLIIGAATFSGSVVAGAKLADWLRQPPTNLPGHNWILLGTLATVGLLCVPAAIDPGRASAGILSALVLVSFALGGLFAVRIGGADMPVLISFLNATAGLAAAFCGLSIGNRLLTACGATVAASGSILTQQMCLAMNRSLPRVFLPRMVKPPGPDGARAKSPVAGQVSQVEAQNPLSIAIGIAKNATTVMIIPGYGMAQAQAQFETVKLANRLRDMGKQVTFAIHPVAGRMPGHMHVLLAEAEADSEMLMDIRDANPQFARTDVAVIIGACDVVNPAAITATGTPISGMPILKAHEARHVIVCNLDGSPGYSGVENPLYADRKTVLLFGDARVCLERLLKGLSQLSRTDLARAEAVCSNGR